MNPLINLANRHYYRRLVRRKLNLRIRVNGRDRSSVDEFIRLERSEREEEGKGKKKGTILVLDGGGEAKRGAAESAVIILIFAITQRRNEFAYTREYIVRINIHICIYRKYYLFYKLAYTYIYARIARVTKCIPRRLPPRAIIPRFNALLH